MWISLARTALLALALTPLGAACGPPAPDHSEEKLQCLRGCAAQKDACILGAQVAAQIQQCDGQNQACVGTCPR
jgi:hypothetical protein